MPWVSGERIQTAQEARVVWQTRTEQPSIRNAIGVPGFGSENAEEAPQLQVKTPA